MKFAASDIALRSNVASARSYRSKAIVLNRTRLSEKDLILTLLLEDGSQGRAVAKGARRPGGRLAARVELFSETDFLFARGRSLDVVSEAVLLDAHAKLRGNYDRVAAASAIAQIAYHTSFEDAPDPYLWPICSRALLACEEAEAQAMLDLVVAAYTMKVLAHEGWYPELNACCMCADKALSYVSPRAGGALCSSCARNVSGAVELDAIEFSWFRSLISATFSELLAGKVSGPVALLMLSLAHTWAATHLDCRLKAMEFLVGKTA